MKRTSAPLVVLALLVAAPGARGHDPDYTPGQLAKVRACVDRLRKILRSGGLTPKAAWSFDLAEFTPHDLGHAPDLIRDLPPELKEALRRVCLTTYYRRGPAGRLKRARKICFLLGGASDTDWLRAFRLLRREEPGKDLERAVVALGRDARPQLRAVAARLATTLILFGHRSEGLLGTVLASLTDRDPNVAATIAFNALDTREKRVVDRMVAILADHRALDPFASPGRFLRGWRSVSDVVVYRLSWAVYMERKARRKWRRTLDTTGEPEYEELSPDAIRAWWKEHRDTFGFATPTSHWRNTVDQVVVLEVEKPVRVQTKDGTTLTVKLLRYNEGWLAGAPVTTAEAEITRSVFGEEELVVQLGNPDHRDGFLSWERTSDGTALGGVVCQGAFLPTDRPRRVRLKLIVHVSREPK